MYFRGLAPANMNDDPTNTVYETALIYVPIPATLIPSQGVRVILDPDGKLFVKYNSSKVSDNSMMVINAH